MSRQCEYAIPKTGARCRGGAMAGHPHCGPHANKPATPSSRGSSMPARPRSKSRTVEPTRSSKGLVPCPGCGLPVHVAGNLVSWHQPVNGCEVDSLG